jgi:NAD(P)-dependent dehydrogenase (short-subunit alcohol dehydrogenase family)
MVTQSGPVMQKRALILGASSGFGAAASLALARNGYDIVGVHLDRRATLVNAERIISEIRALNRKAIFFNVNAADPARRAEIIGVCQQELAAATPEAGIDVLLHSLAFGTLKPFISGSSENAIRQADMNMTLDVMAHSLVYWVQDLLAAGLLKRGSRILAMTSAGSHRIWTGYGAVSAAKASLESHIRQLAVELGPYGISANALCAGVTDTPAARKIPGSGRMFERAMNSNPGGRLTAPEDVAEFIISLLSYESSWMTGNVIRLDGGEDLVG